VLSADNAEHPAFYDVAAHNHKQGGEPMNFKTQCLVHLVAALMGTGLASWMYLAGLMVWGLLL
jgi:hypothetical protein